MEDLIKEIKQMRAAQDEYHRTKDWQILQVVVTLEKRVDKMIENYEAEHSPCEDEYMICDVCGKKKHMSEFSKRYKSRCKECVNAHERARRRLKAEKDYDLEAITLQLDRKKMQARQIYPNTIIVPYDKAVEVMTKVINHYKSKK